MLRVELMETGGQCLFGLLLAMHHPNLSRPLLHPSHKFHQPFLIRVGRVATDAVNASADIEALTIQVYIAAFRAEGLDRVPGRAFGLVADEEDVVPFVAQHGFQVIDDAATRAHAATGNHDGGAGSLGQVVHYALVVAVAVYCDGLFEAQRSAPGLDSVAGFLAPEGFQLTVGCGEAAGQG